MTTITQPGSLGEQKPTEPMTVHTVQGGGGLRLHVRKWGRPDGPPILLIHGISASHLCWARQYQSKLAKEFRLVAYDLRGHGMSQAPLEPEHYTNAKLWADDVAAIIQQLGLERPVLVGWSYGGYISATICAPTARTASARSTSPAGPQVGPGSLRHADRPRLPGPFRRLHRRRPADQHPRHARPGRGLRGHATAGRRRRDAAVLSHDRTRTDPRQPRRPRDRRRRRAPHAAGAAAGQPGPGGHDRAPGDGRAHPGHLPDRRGLLVRGVGHTPFLEDPERFNRELAALARRVSSSSSTQ